MGKKTPLSNLLSLGFVSPSFFISIHSNYNSLNMVLCLSVKVKGPRVVSECMMSLECDSVIKFVHSRTHLPQLTADSAPCIPPLGSRLGCLALIS